MGEWGGEGKVACKDEAKLREVKRGGDNWCLCMYVIFFSAVLLQKIMDSVLVTG